MKRIPITTLSFLVIGYMILAFGWWSFHLWQQNDQVLAQKNTIIALKYPEGGEWADKEKNRALDDWHKGHRMILAEGLFFVACLAWGMRVIRRSAVREMSLSRQRRNFLLSITHELKSPIAAMKLILETLGRKNLTPEQGQNLRLNALKDADRLHSLVESLLLAARLEDEWRPLPEPLDVPEICRDIVERLRIRFPESQFELPAPTPDLPRLQADKQGFTSVVQNLLENAAKYSPPHARIRAAYACENGVFHITISDEGKGIPDAEKKAVFEKFYRMGNEETRQATGTGLGLYIVNQVLKAHGGRILLKDNTPKGTVFEITIPNAA